MGDKAAKVTPVITAILAFLLAISCVYSPISWSPNSAYIAFVRSRGTPGDLGKAREFEIWIASPDGKTKHRLVSAEGRLSAPAWSPRGDEIAYLSSMEEGLAEVIILDVKKAEPKTIVSFDIPASDETLSIYSCAWSPDGKRLLLPVLEEDGLNICTVDINGKEKRYTALGKASTLPAISHDAKRAAYLAPNRGGTGLDLIIAPLKDGAEPYTLVENASRSLGDVKFQLLSWSPDDKKIAYASAAEAEGDPADLFLVDVRSRKTSRFAHHPQGCWAPAWSPDGKSIAYVVRRGEAGTEIVIAKSRDGEVKRIVGRHGINWGPTWSPNGRWLAFRTTIEDAVQLSLVRTVKPGGSEDARFIVLDDFDQLTLAGYYWDEAKSVEKDDPTKAKGLYDRAQAEFRKALKDYPKSIYREDAIAGAKRMEKERKGKREGGPP